MRDFILTVAFTLVCCPLLGGCGGRSEPRVVEGTGDEVTAEMIEVEEAELETTE